MKHQAKWETTIGRLKICSLIPFSKHNSKFKSLPRREGDVEDHSPGGPTDATGYESPDQPAITTNEWNGLLAFAHSFASETRSHEPLFRYNSITFDLSALLGRRPRFCANTPKNLDPMRTAQAPPAKLATALLATGSPARGTKKFAGRFPEAKIKSLCT